MADPTASPNETPPGARELRWEVESVRTPYEDSRFSVREHRVRVPRKREPVTYSIAERAPGVLVVPVTARGEIMLIRQYRYPVDAWCLEIPAGSRGDTGDMPAEEVARKELHEEIGATVGELERVTAFYTAAAFCTEVCDVFLGWDAELAERAEPEPTEVIEVVLRPAAEALWLARSGEMKNAVCALAVCCCEDRLRARGFLD